MAAAAGAVAASYPKTLSKDTVIASNWNLDGGARRSFDASNPNKYNDTVSGWTNPTVPAGYKLQLRFTGYCENHDTCHTHQWHININGVTQYTDNVQLDVCNGGTYDNRDTGYQTVPYASTGTMVFVDGYAGGTSGNSHSQSLYIYYQFARS